MKFTLLNQGWQSKLIGSVAIVGTFFTAMGESVLAQIVPDNTLGAESSVVIPDVTINGIPSDQIEGGAIRGTNLFHSFEQFSILQGQGAYFTNPAGITNILSRVTGANRSDILGRLGVLGNANLFLINPNGIVFGPDASLDVQGSFVATTADAIRLGDGGLFSASEPGSSNLLTVSPSALWFNAVAAQPINNQSRLEVPDGQTLALVGGNVRLEGGRLTAAGGRIELGSVAGVGEVSLSQTGNRLVLGYDSVNGFGDILLSDGAVVTVSGEGGGDVQVRGARLEMTDASFIFASTFGAGNGGEVLVKTTEEVVLREASLRATVSGSGTGGNITIETGQLLIEDGAIVATSTRSEGAAGNLTVLASERVEVTGSDVFDGSSSFLSSTSSGKGDAGDMRIETGQLLIEDGAQVSTTAFDEGAGGNLTVVASEGVEVTGSDVSDGSSSLLISQSGGKGDAGDMRIETGQLLIEDGASVSTTAFDEGAGGNLTVLASEGVQVTGSDAFDGSSSGLGSASFSKGDAGNLTIETGLLLIEDGAIVTTSTGSEGAGGNLTVVASEGVQVTGSDVFDGSSSFLASQSGGTGDAGNLTIETRQLLISNGASVSTNAFDEGAGGNLTVVASERVQVTGSDDDGFPSGLGSQSGGKGDAGNLTIETGLLLIEDGAIVTTDAFDEGAGGNLTVVASQGVEVTGSNAFDGFSSILSSQSQGKGDAGDIRIETGYLLIEDGAQVSTTAFDEGTGGNLTVVASDSVLLDNQGDLRANSRGTGNTGNINMTVGGLLSATDSDINTSSDQSAGGAITIKAGDIRLWGDSDIITSVFSGADNGGNITLTADSILAFNDSDILAFARDGRGGDITLNTPAFFGQNYQPAPRNTDPDTLDNNNRVDINATGAVSGDITLPDTTFIENSLTELPDNQIDTDSLLASSCIVRRNQPQKGSFFITGTGGFAQRPGDLQMSTFPTVDIETLPSESTIPNRPWQKGDPIIEPQGVYRLPNGKLVLSRECPD
jgi:filamentous hemagglutinin family protein